MSEVELNLPATQAAIASQEIHVEEDPLGLFKPPIHSLPSKHERIHHDEKLADA